MKIFVQIDYFCLQCEKAEKIQIIESAKDRNTSFFAHQRCNPRVSSWLISHVWLLWKRKSTFPRYGIPLGEKDISS